VTTVISHFFNEEYLLPWWLEHHKNMFDHGIMIDYNSTDRSVEIIKRICPTWEIIRSRNQFFGAREIDSEVMDIEKLLSGWRIALNTTEFLIGDLSIINKPRSSFNYGYVGEEVIYGIGIPVSVMVDLDNVEPVYDVPLVSQKTDGIHYAEGGFDYRKGRLLHNKPGLMYPVGRHYKYTTEDLMILWYGWSPYNQRLIDRKLQIQDRMPLSDKQSGLGTSHLRTQDELNAEYETFKKQSRSLTKDINKLL